jgi:mannitol-1-phosphate 5-dehydrogenase
LHSRQNLVGATSRLKEFVLSHLTSRVDQAWVAEYIGFADCSVDRIVPPFDPSRASSPTASAAASPISSPCPSPSLPLASSPSPPPSPSLEPILDVGVESFYEWVVDRTQLKEPLPLVKGWTLTKNLRAYNERKLYTLNTGHCIAAYLGYLKGVFTIDEAIADPEIEAAVRGALAESGTALCAKHGFTSAEHATYVDKTIRRLVLSQPSLAVLDLTCLADSATPTSATTSSASAASPSASSGAPTASSAPR